MLAVAKLIQRHLPALIQGLKKTVLVVSRLMWKMPRGMPPGLGLERG